MTMRMKVVHTTTFEYDGTANASYNQARLTPRTTPEQIVLHTRLDVSPAPWTHSYRDYFGTEVTTFEVFDPHESLTVSATSTVQTNRPPAPGPQLSWTDLASPDVVDARTEYLLTSPMVAPTSDLADRARALAADAATPGAAARAMCDLVHQEVSYITGSTSVVSHAADAWNLRGGVCQDMAHLVIGGLRTMGIPARYVSGYLHPSSSPLIGEAVAGESHAWVQWWDDGWQAWDIANAVEPLDRHVVIAAGRDYTDVKPLSGIFTGGGTSDMTVDVQVTCLFNSALDEAF
jgi:transglutaminase-like putative cysteine protease